MNKPVCKLVGIDGNVFSVIGAVTKALKKAGDSKGADEFRTKALQCGSYDAVLALVFEYVEVK
jgi:hypothetical protein